MRLKSPMQHYWSRYLAKMELSLNFFFLSSQYWWKQHHFFWSHMYVLGSRTQWICWKALWNLRNSQVTSLPRWDAAKQSWLKLSSWVHLFIKCWLTDAWPLGTGLVPLAGCLAELLVSPPSALPTNSRFCLHSLCWLAALPEAARCCQKIESPINDNKIDSVQAETSDKNDTKNSQWKVITEH